MPSLSSAVTNTPITSQALAQRYNLTNVWTAPVPSSPISNAASYIISNYNLNNDRILSGSNDISYLKDPFDSNSTTPVLAVQYPAGSYSPSNSFIQGGVHFYATPFNGAQFGEMLLHYDVAFDPTFQFNLGGKLPGLFGGNQFSSCSGGNQANGDNCWSIRLMWRQQGAGEIYAYIPTTNSFCTQSDVVCNYDYGKSIGRNLFYFTPSVWNSIDLYVGLNNPPSASNGRLSVYFNGDQVIDFKNMQFRTSGSQTDGLLISALMFSTFFGGNSAAWASPTNTSSYFRNIKLFAPEQPNFVIATGKSSIISSSKRTLLTILFISFFFIMMQ